MSSWWQKKLVPYALRYVLSKSGLLDDKVLDLDNLNFTIGKRSVIHLKDVGLNIKQITKQLDLPSCLRIETARILSLRITIPADFYQSSFVVEVDGVDVVLRLEEETPSNQSQPKTGNRSPTNARAPQHRKTNRRIQSPPPYDPGGLSDSEEELHIPTTQEVANSFLMAEPTQERKELEAVVAANTKSVEESFVSESSDGDDVGTGMGVGVPGFLSGFLQGVIDRFRFEVKNVQVRVEAEIRGDGRESIPVTLRLKVGGVVLDSLNPLQQDQPASGDKRRTVGLSDISVDILSDSTVLAELSDLQSQLSPTDSKSPAQSPRTDRSSLDSIQANPASTTNQSSSSSGSRSFNDAMPTTLPPPSSTSPPAMQTSTASLDTNQFADARDNEPLAQLERSDFDIRPGDDNISWGSRRSNTSAPAEDLWKSMVSEDDLPESLFIEPERATTPRAHSSRGSSPFAERQRRAVSPYDRSLQHPGSWPRMDESLERHRSQTGPGSWPALDQSQHSAYEPLAQMLTANDEMITDNKRIALDHTESNEDDLQTPPEPQDPVVDDMMQSRVFSHEEAQSMYMSAMTGSPDMAMPGGWGSDTLSERSSSPEAPRKLIPEGLPSLDGAMQSTEPPIANVSSGNVTPRAQTPGLPSASATAASKSLTCRELLFIDSVSVSIPTKTNAASTVHATPLPNPQKSVRASKVAHGMPGTFSAYSEMSSSRRAGVNSVYGDPNSVIFAPREPSDQDQEVSLEISVGTVFGQVDVSTGRLLYSVSAKALASLGASQDEKSKNPPKSNVDQKAALAISVQLEHLQLSLHDHLDTQMDLKRRPAGHHGTIDVSCDNICFQQSSDTHLRVGAFELQLGGKELLAFANDGLAESHMSAADDSVISLHIAKNRFAANGRPVSDVSLKTAVLQLTVDLTLIDETFNSFGGLSGMMELGNSVLSDSGASSPIARKPSPKGVRFAGQPEPPSSSPELKLNGRLGGVTVLLRGPPCSLLARTGTVKAVYREHGVVSTIEHASLSGPFVGNAATAPVTADLASLRIEYLTTPQDKDLERLISLLNPSKDKFDNDDDILIDTLLRQRRKGGLLRAIIDDVKVKIENWNFLPILTALESDLSKLSAVAKYLPEDERPGLLTLVRSRAAEAQLPVNERFGKLRLSVKDLHLAHVGIPPLLAFSIASVHVKQVNGPELLHALVPPKDADNLPLVMARMLGDDAVKIKLYNIAVEYSVPVILDLTSIDQEAEPAEIAANLAHSVANLALAEPLSSPMRRGPTSDSSKPPKKIDIDLLIHDSAIGLTPHKLSAKAVLVLSDARIATTMPPGDTMVAKLELRQASVFITDHEVEIPVEPAAPGRVTLEYADSSNRVTRHLTDRGFVSVATLRAGEVTFKAKDNANQEPSKTIEVEVKNDLLLLETCADSTDTLFATLGALAPPTPPSKEPKYLTQPMPVEDLMQSFSGDALPVPREEARPPSVLYDVDGGPGSDGMGSPTLSGLGASALEDEPDELLYQSEMAGSLYGPVSGILGMEADTADESTLGDDYPETAESLLEEDPFEMAEASVLRMGDAALMRDLGRQCKPAIDEEPVDLGLYEIEDLGFDPLTGQQALGDRNRFNAPHVGGRRRKVGKETPRLPFRLCLRDANVMWHMYDGYDWQSTRDGISEMVEQVEQKAEERRARRRQSRNEPEDDESIIGDVLFNSIYIGIPANHEAEELRKQINRAINEDVSETASVPASGISRPTTSHSASGQQPRQRQRRRLKLGRSTSHKMSLELKGVAADVMVLPPGGEVVSSIDLRIKDFEIFDKVPSSTWRKFLTHRDDPSVREMSKPMFHIQVENVKTIRSHAATDIMLHVTALPLRLHVDQDAQQFMVRFFSFNGKSTSEANVPEEDKPYIARIEVDDIYLCLDYKPKNLDWIGLRGGKTSEFMNILTLEAANIRLQHAIVHGIGGFDQLHPKLDALWTPDVIQNQLPRVMSGLAAARGLVNLGVGLRDVVAIPIREYKKDGRVVRSIQKGAYHFGKTTTSELARLGAKVAMGTQTLLSGAEEMLSPTERRVSTDQDVDEEEVEKRAVSAYASQPIGVMSGLRSARRHLEHDLLTAKDALIAVQGEFLESRTPGSAAAAVARHAPTVILRPVIGATRAVGTTLLGVGNQIDRGNLRRVEDKYKPR